ncbi:uncharacterized protein EI90DRAFT_2847110, partial [Cantharellus anzutake]|uniref:uncharacterized protein n=1 Tax=Cantharellus anzutake TaxID=1750568 RepID=UPI001907A2D1
AGNEDEGQPFAPFQSKEEWELSYWLSTEGISKGAIDCFRKLQWVNGHPHPLSWQDASTLYQHVREMPGPPLWKSEVIIVKEAPSEPQTLYWRDPVECAHFLFQNPNFKESMTYAP